MSRRRFLAMSLGTAAAATLAACSSPRGTATVVPSSSPTGPVAQEIRLRAREAQIDLGGRAATAWTFGDRVPGAAIRAKAGERVRITVTNDLPEETSVHWHGLAIPKSDGRGPRRDDTGDRVRHLLHLRLRRAGRGHPLVPPPHGPATRHRVVRPFHRGGPRRDRALRPRLGAHAGRLDAGRGPGPAADLRRPGLRRSAQ